MNAPEMMDGDPLERYLALYADAQSTETFDASRAVLATADPSGRPAARFVLVREVGEGGFVFYTDYRSRKSLELEANPKGALAFHWSTTGVQVRAEGRVERASAARSDAYFAARPRGSQLGAWASIQSASLQSRGDLEAAVTAIEPRFADQDVPRPEHWGGWVLVPDMVEFWFNQDDRLHDRFEYVRGGDAWTVRRLSP